MKNTKANLLKVLKKKKKCAISVLTASCKDGNKENIISTRSVIWATDYVIDLLTDQEFFDKIWAVYKDHIDK